MLYNYYRFHLADNTPPFDPERINNRLEQLVQENKELGLVRIATDLSSTAKSISVLGSNKDSGTVQTKIKELLLAEGIAIDPQMATETLEDNELTSETHQHPHEHDCLEHCHDDKHKHAHDHPQEHCHNDTHKHSHNHKHPPQTSNDGHGHSHSHAHDHSYDHGHGHSHDDDGHGHSHAHDNHWLKAGVGIAWGIGLLILSLLSLNIPLIAYYIIT